MTRDMPRFLKRGILKQVAVLAGLDMSDAYACSWRIGMAQNLAAEGAMVHGCR